MSQPHTSAETGSRTIPIVAIADLDADPHGAFRRYRGETPFLQGDDGAYLAIRAADVETLITDPRTRQLETEFLKLRGITSGPIFEIIGQSMVFSNEVPHRSRRAPMSRAFAFRTVAGIRPRIRAVAEGLIEARLSEGRMNLLDDYAALIPALTIASILGLPDEDLPSFTRSVYSFTRVLNPSFTPDEVPDITRAAAELLDYVERLVADRRHASRDDFSTSFVKAAEEAGELSLGEILSQLVTVIVAGSDTTRAAMAIQVALLLQDRPQWEAVCSNPPLIPGTVSEALRYEPAIGSVPRFTTADIAIDGYVIPAGRVLRLSTMSAMRDTALYADPDRFDIRRSDHPRWHQVFGGGAHRCLGEALARAELEEGLAALAARLPRLQLSGEPPSLQGHAGIRRIGALHVSWPQ
ncbi:MULTISPECIES: cytochrome P450 [Rhodomicrobium]|uniref:cytochrome P450 n=1 Tax=Rhodomicrobium TaxID=1068 RepID=UPI000B4A5A3C|nr:MULTISPECIES: cytochrome P450 [Rhodomicrobium]